MKEIARTVIAARNTDGVATEVGNENEQITTSGDTTTTAQTDRGTPIPPRDLAPGHAEIRSHTQVETNLQERRVVDIEAEIGELLLPFSVYVVYFKHFGWIVQFWPRVIHSWTLNMDAMISWSDCLHALHMKSCQTSRFMAP